MPDNTKWCTNPTCGIVFSFDDEKTVKRKTRSENYAKKASDAYVAQKPVLKNNEKACPYCGYTTEKTDKFCKRCGKELTLMPANKNTPADTEREPTINITQAERKTMKAITCELCGSNDIQKQEGFYVCQHCGTKYSVDEAKKLLGTVRVDNTQKVDNLFTLARRAKSNNNSEDAEKYYDLIRQELPDNWEANFYAVYYRARNCKIGEIAWAGNSISNCIHSSFEMIKRNLTDDQERISAVSEICQSAYSISEMLDSAAHSHYDSIDESIRFNYYNELSANTNAASKIKETVCDELCLVFGDDKAVFTTVGFKYVKAWIKETYNCEKYIIAVQKYEPDYVDLDAPRKERERQENIRLKESMLKELDEMQATLDAALKKSSGSGCYIATAVYGSYDCPEVWTLRRFRDYILAQTWYGRLFIQVYYAVSPTLVKWFGNEKWFKRLWKPPLDRKIKKLNSQGVPNTPYFR